MTSRWTVVIILFLVTIGSVVFHIVTPWWSTPIASNWGSIDDIIDITFWITGVVFVLVLLFMTYCVYRFRYRPDRRAEFEPENKKLEWWLTGLTTLGVVGMLAPGLFVWKDFVTVPEGAAVVEVVGKQWSWSYRFPGKDGKFGKSDARFIDDDNPFGINPKDPAGKDDILVDDTELHLPLGRAYKVLLRSTDVLHDFYVPQFRAKMDLVPGTVTYFWFKTIRMGTFDVLCAELCGVGHHNMRGKVVVESVEAFQAWMKEQQTFEQSLKEARGGTEKKSQPVVIEARRIPGE